MIRRGEIYRVSLGPTKGREQRGRRPVLVVSVDSINRQPLVITVVPGTDASNLPRDYPTNVRVASRETGLPADTVFFCFQLRSLDPARFVNPVTGSVSPAGTMPPAAMSIIEQSLKRVLGL